MRFALLRADFQGVVGEEQTRFACTFEVRVFASGWTTVPLFGEELAVTGLVVEEGPVPPPAFDSAPPGGISATEHEIRGGEESRAEGGAAGTAAAADGASAPPLSPPPPAEPAVTLVSDGAHALLISRPGHYTVHLDVLAGFRGEVGRSGLRFGVPRSAITRLELALPRTGLDVTVKRALSRECQELDEAAERAEDEPQGAFTRLVAMLAPTTQMQIEWTQAVDETAEPAVPARPVLTADAETLVGVGEGLLLCQSRVKMDVIQGQLSRFRYLLPADVNVLGVSCSAARTWRIRELAVGESVPPLTSIPATTAATRERPASGPTQLHESGDAAPSTATSPVFAPKDGDTGEGLGVFAAAQLIELHLSHDVSGAHTVHLVYERRMEATSGRVNVPPLEVLDVDRQRGYIGVEARTNVEVAVADDEAVARLDVQELPDNVTEVAQNPLLFGFKYLRVPYSVALDIHKHEDVEVLVASIDLACVEATLVESGKLETKCVFKVRNNQQQFLRLKLPAASTVWSSFVSQHPVKPASDAKTGELLIPLTKSQLVEDLHRAFPVELVYLTEVAKLDEQAGEFTFALPAVDVPMHHLLVELHVPKEYRFDRFEGSLKHVPRFSRSFEVNVAPQQQDFTRTQAGGRPRGAMTQVAAERNVAFDDTQQQREKVYEEALTESQLIDTASIQDVAHVAPAAPKKARLAPAGFGGSSKGILPVKLELPKVGETVRFEQLLVLDEPATTTFRYRKRRRPNWPWPRK